MAKYTIKQMEAELADQKGNPAGLAAYLGRKNQAPLRKKGKHHAQISRFVKRHHKGGA